MRRKQTQTDANGRFVWRGAPDEAVELNFGACQSREFLGGLVLQANEAEQVVQMKPGIRLAAKVFEESTEKPISLIKVIPGYAWNDKDISWQRESAKSYTNGRFDWSTDRVGEKRIFLIEAEGYDSYQTKTFAANQSDYRETFYMRPKKR